MSAIWIPKRLVDLNLINTRGLSKQSFIRHCEFEYESRVYAAAKEIIRAAGLLDKFDKIQDNMNKMWLGEEISLQKPQELKRFLKKYY